jgi:hypothetical protein
MTDRTLSADDFARYIGKGFTPGGQDRRLTLESIDRRIFAGTEGMRRAPFTLLFSGARGDVLPEGLYEFVMGDGTDFALFISPIQTFDSERQDYQAVFN